MADSGSIQPLRYRDSETNNFKKTQPKMSILLQKKIRNLKKIFCLVLIVSLLRMGYLYIQEKYFRITDLQNELRFEIKL